MNGGAPRCPRCGGLSTNPNDVQCRFCGAGLHAAPFGAPPPHAYAPQPYAPQPYAPQPYAPQPYAPQPYAGGVAPFGSGPTQHGYGSPGPYPNAGYAPPGPYPTAPVQSFGGNYGRQIDSGPFGSGWSSFIWFRLAIVAIAISLSLVGACISAITN